MQTNFQNRSNHQDGTNGIGRLGGKRRSLLPSLLFGFYPTFTLHTRASPIFSDHLAGWLVASRGRSS